jgi:hypothetical protein
MPANLSTFPGALASISNSRLNVRYWHLADIGRRSLKGRVSAKKAASKKIAHRRGLFFAFSNLG